MESRQADITAPINLKQDGKGIVIYIPNYRGEHFDGFTVGVYRVQKILSSYLERYEKDYSFEVLYEEQLLYSSRKFLQDKSMGNGALSCIRLRQPTANQSVPFSN